MKLVLNVTDDVRRAWFVSTGTRLGEQETVEVDPSGLSEEARGTLYDALHACRDSAYALAEERWRAEIYPQSTEDWEALLASYKVFAAERPAREAAKEAEQLHEEAERKARQEVERAERLQETLAAEAAWMESGRQATWVTSQSSSGQYLGDYPAVILRNFNRTAMISPECIAEAHRRRQAEEDKERQAEAEAQAIADKERADKLARYQERAAWIAANGSAHLQKALAAEYDCWRLYVTERAAVDYPGYTPDFSAKPRYKPMSCPSEEALDEAARLGGRVVWIVSNTPGEGVCITDFLGKYTLLRQLSGMAAEQTKAA